MAIHWHEATASQLKELVNTPNFGLITDVDGTISPIVEHPSKAKVTETSRTLLTRLVEQLPCVAAVSGRDGQTLYDLVGIPGMTYVGNHGLEHWKDGKVVVHPDVTQYRPAMLAAQQAIKAQAMEGVWIEDKQSTLTIHYRQSTNPELVGQKLEGLIAKVAAENGLHYFPGRMIFELRPPLKVNKGTTLTDLVHDHKLAGALYLGDDITDVDAFKAAGKLRESQQCYSWAVGVVSTETPAVVAASSDFVADGVPDVEALLAWLLSERMASST